MRLTCTDEMLEFVEAVADECGVTQAQLDEAARNDNYGPALQVITHYIMDCNRTHLELLRKIQVAIQRHAD